MTMTTSNMYTNTNMNSNFFPDVEHGRSCKRSENTNTNTFGKIGHIDAIVKQFKILKLQLPVDISNVNDVNVELLKFRFKFLTQNTNTNTNKSKPLQLPVNISDVNFFESRRLPLSPALEGVGRRNNF